MIAVVLLVVSVAATIAQPWLVARRATRRDQPPVSVVLPVKMLDDQFDRTQKSALTQQYRDFDVTVSATDVDGPAVQHMRAILARHPTVPSRILLSTAKFAVSPKVDNLYAPFMQATHDVILMKDANVLLEPDALAQHVRQLTDEVGLVCAIPYCARLENFAAHVEAAIINGPHARILFLASALGQGHGIGKIMLFRRSDFLRAGGFDAISHTVGEDNALAKAMRRIGKRPVFSHRPVRQELGARASRRCLSPATALDGYPSQRRTHFILGRANMPSGSSSYRFGARGAARRDRANCRRVGDAYAVVCA
jgi:ceramide glucosyltransferase